MSRNGATEEARGSDERISWRRRSPRSPSTGCGRSRSRTSPPRPGLTRGAILYYYDDLDELLREAHRAGLERFCDARDAVVAAIEKPQEQLAAAIREGPAEWSG